MWKDIITLYVGSYIYLFELNETEENDFDLDNRTSFVPVCVYFKGQQEFNQSVHTYREKENRYDTEKHVFKAQTELSILTSLGIEKK